MFHRLLFLASVLVFLCVNVICEECNIPKKIVDAKDWNATDSASLYLPIGQRNDTALVKQILYESSLNPDEDLAKLCFRTKLGDESLVISGANGTMANFACQKSDTKKWILNCNHESKKPEYGFKLFITLTDKKSYAVGVRCWGSGLKSWTVFSTKKFLHDDVQIQILEHVKSLGFETIHTLPLRYRQC